MQHTLPLDSIMAMPLPRQPAPEPLTIPDRLYFKIGDVARICGVKTYVLRFWETQFPQLKPNKSGTGQRLFRRRDVEMALRIKQLVHEEGYTLAGARQFLEQSPRANSALQTELPLEAERLPQARLALTVSAPAQASESLATAIQLARTELRELAELLAAPDPQPARKRARVAATPAQSGSLFPL